MPRVFSIAWILACATAAGAGVLVGAIGGISPTMGVFGLSVLVVVIIGVLATLGVAGVRSKMRQSKRVEVVSGLQEIAKTQDRFRAEHGTYLNVSPDLKTYYPPLNPGSAQNFWGHTGEAPWRELGPELPQLVSFSYATIAGLPFSTPSAVDPGGASPRY